MPSYLDIFLTLFLPYIKIILYILHVCSYLCTHSLNKLSKLHFQNNTDISNSNARKYKCLTNQYNVTLDPCMYTSIEIISFFPHRSHMFLSEGKKFGWLRWKPGKEGSVSITAQEFLLCINHANIWHTPQNLNSWFPVGYHSYLYSVS